MKKIFLLLGILFLVTGCDVEYQLQLQDNTFYEKISFSMNNTIDSPANINNLLEMNPYAVFQNGKNELFKKTVVTQENPTIVEFEYDYRSTNYQNAKVFKDCYESYNVFHYDDMYHITTGERFNCMTYDYRAADKIIIKFTTNHKVIETNADKRNKNTYIWEITNDNADKKPILIKVSDQPKESIKHGFSFPMELVVVLAISAILGIIIFVVIKVIQKKNNKI